MNHATAAGLLPSYANGTLGEREGRRVEEHLRTCASCRAELASWRSIRSAVDAAQADVPDPPPAVLESVLARIETGRNTGSPAAGGRLSLVWQLLVGQTTLLRREIWTASAATMAMGCLVAALTSAGPTAAGQVFALFAPVVAAVGVAFVYGPENDPSLEIALSTPTGPRLVLLARLVIVYGYDLSLALAATGVLAIVGGTFGAWPLISLWIGPMLFLSASGLVVSLLVSPTAAVLLVLSLWGLRLFAANPAPDGEPPVWAEIVLTLWQAESLLLPLAAALLVVALLYAPRAARTSAARSA